MPAQGSKTVSGTFSISLRLIAMGAVGIGHASGY
jgi:hypothetical protein